MTTEQHEAILRPGKERIAIVLYPKFTALDVIGPESVLWGQPGGPAAGGVRPVPRQWLWSQAASIAGGTTEVQKSIIGERLLGLPRG